MVWSVVSIAGEGSCDELALAAEGGDSATPPRGSCSPEFEERPKVEQTGVW